MKKLRSLFAALLVIALAISFVNCDDDDDDDNTTSNNPILTIVTSFSGTTVQAWRGEQFSFSITAAENEVSGKELVDLEVDIIAPGKDSSNTYAIGASSYTLNLTYEVPQDVQDQNSITISFTLNDKAGKSTTKTFVFNIVDPADVDTYTGIELGAQSNATLGSFFSTSTGQVFLVSEARNNQQLVDWIYIYDTKAGPYTAVFASPDHSSLFGTNYSSQYPVYDVHNYTIKRSTRFKQIALGSITVAEFDNMTSVQLANKYNNNSNPERDYAPYLVDQAGGGPSWFAFKTGSGKYGVFVVTKITDYQPTGSLIFNAKVQK